jgi:hypothetical protein
VWNLRYRGRVRFHHPVKGESPVATESPLGRAARRNRQRGSIRRTATGREHVWTRTEGIAAVAVAIAVATADRRTP